MPWMDPARTAWVWVDGDRWGVGVAVVGWVQVALAAAGVELRGMNLVDQ